jgi:integrase
MGMEKVSTTLHMLRRNGVWYFKRRVPKDLIGVLKIKTVQFSLGTPFTKIAIKKRERADVEWTARFDEARAKLKSGGKVSSEPVPNAQRPLTRPLAMRLVQEDVDRRDRLREEAGRSEPPLDGAAFVEARKEIEGDLHIALGRARHYDCDEFAASEADLLLKQSGAVVDEHLVVRAELENLVRRGAVELSRRALARLDRDRSRSHFDDLFDPERPPSVTVTELVAQFVALKEQEGAAQKQSRKNLDKQRANATLIEEILGGDTLVRDVKYDACREAVAVLAHVPPNRTKKYKGMPLTEAIKQAENEGQAPLSFVSQSQYLGTLKELIELAVNKELLAKNYASDLRPLRRDDVAAENKREPFDLHQLRQFFHCLYYEDCGRYDVPYRHAEKGWRFWLPLLQLFMGMRPREICQMHVSDLCRTENGTWFVDIVATDDEDDVTTGKFKKTTKTKTSRRKVPLHPELIKIGFVRFVDEQGQASDDPRVFRDITRDRYDDPAHYPLRRFREKYLKEAVSLRPRQSPYSFRHSWRDATRHIRASNDFLKGVGAWAGATTTADNYGSKSNPDFYAEEMSKIAYDGLDLSHLYPKN